MRVDEPAGELPMPAEEERPSIVICAEPPKPAGEPLVPEKEPAEAAKEPVEPAEGPVKPTEVPAAAHGDDVAEQASAPPPVAVMTDEPASESTPSAESAAAPAPAPAHALSAEPVPALAPAPTPAAEPPFVLPDSTDEQGLC